MNERKIYDCFGFLNELSLLEIRLNTLNDIVDYFVICEAGETHSGEKKPFNLQNNSSLFSKFHHKIIYIPIEKFNTNNIDLRDVIQRDACRYGLQNAKSNDLVIINDLDEIPRPEALVEAINNINNTGETQCLESQLYFYGVNCKCVNHPIWPAPSISLFKNYGSPQALRTNAGDKFNRVKNGGWHYSYCGSLDKIMYKISSYTHSVTTNKPEINNKEYLKKCIEDKVSLIPGCDRKFELITPDYSNSPKYLVDNINKFQHLLV